MTSTEKSDAIIIGAGIGGLTAALALSRIGMSVTIFERSAKLDEIGAGIQLTPNASRVLVELGLEAELRKCAATPAMLEIGRLSKPSTLIMMSLDSLAKKHGAPWFTLRRSDLQNVLLGAVQRDPHILLRLGQTIELFTQTQLGVLTKSRTLADMLQEQEASVLVGADGIWSSIRSYVSNPEPPHFCGFEAWRTIVPASAAISGFGSADTVRLYLGYNCHLVAYPVHQDGTTNIVLIRRASEPRDMKGRQILTNATWSHTGLNNELEPILSQASTKVRQLLETIDDWRVWSLYDMPVARMADGHVALIGDAAHPVLPFLAQGAALAIEDAAALAKSLERARGDRNLFPAALQNFAAKRQKRANSVRSAAKRNAFAYHMKWPLSLARDKALGLLGGNNMARQYEWLYGWHP